jgi:hypothetical protein
MAMSDHETEGNLRSDAGYCACRESAHLGLGFLPRLSGAFLRGSGARGEVEAPRSINLSLVSSIITSLTCW